MTNLPTCSYQKCQGHLGKFDTCLDEAVYLLSLEFGEGFGDSDSGYAAFVNQGATSVDFVLGDNSPILIPAGGYHIWIASTGGVTVEHFADAADALEKFDLASEAYYDSIEEA